MKRFALLLSFFWLNYLTFAQNPEEVFKEGMAKMEAKDYNAAVERFDLALAAKPDYLDAHFQRGMAKKALLQYNSAINSFNKVIELNPDYLEAYIERAELYSNMGKEEEAMKDFTKVLEKKPDFIEAYLRIGNMYRRKGDSEKAIAEYQKALKINPKYDKAHYNLALYYFNLEKKAEAMKHVKDAIAANPNNAEVYALKGEIELQQRQYKLALASLDKSIQLDNTVGSSYTFRGQAKFFTGNKKGACEDWKKAQELGDTECEEYLGKYCK